MAAVPPLADPIIAAAKEADRVTVLAAQSVPKFASAAEAASYEELRALRAAIGSLEGSLLVSLSPSLVFAVLFRC